MLEFTTIILQFAEQGEKTGWTYIEIPADIAQTITALSKGWGFGEMLREAKR